MTIPKKLKALLKPKRVKLVIGGRGSGKSQTVAQLCVMDAQTKGLKTACFREFQNSIDDSVYSLLKTCIEHMGVGGFEVQANRILQNGEDAFKFRGMARNPDAVKSMHGFKRFWIEEGQTVSAKSLELIMPTLREEGSEVWITANPGSRADPLSQEFIVPYEKELLDNGYYEDDYIMIIVCNYTDNPFFPDVLEQQRIKDFNTKSRALYNHIWLGEFYDEIENAIISADWFDAAIDAHEKKGFTGTGAVIASYDPSDEGADAKGYAARHGSVVFNVLDNPTGDITEGTSWAVDQALKDNADWFVWDGDGMGIAVKSQVSKLLDGRKVDYSIFRGSESVDDPELEYIEADSLDSAKRKTNKDTFYNKRAQFYIKLRDRFYNTWRAVVKGDYVNPDEMISLSSDIKHLDRLRAEVCRIPLKRNNNGKIQIMSKLDMSKLDIPSPNMADALMMCMFAPKPAAKPMTINFKGWG